MEVKGVIFDWAGTTMDYGCFSPVAAFIEAFREIGIELTFDEARKPMGLLKIDHTRALLEMESVRYRFYDVYGRYPNEDDVLNIYDKFEPILFNTLMDYVELNPYVKEVVSELKGRGIKIGSTTGYTRDMMEVIIPIAKENGYEPECCVASDELGYGRPYPYMVYENARRLNIFPNKRIIKVGDTVVDMQEGVNAGCITVGIILGSSELGLSYEEVKTMGKSELENKMNAVRQVLIEAGADYVIEDIRGLLKIIDEINMN
ncbi:MAG: phosphonoacetaldehyde hydrolase [Clostridium sp.]